jgi:hypothetical protein
MDRRRACPVTRRARLALYPAGSNPPASLEVEMRKAMFVLGLAAVAGCSGLTEPDDPASVYVFVSNQRGSPLRPDRVVWYYPPDGPLFDGEHEATCINSGCSVWAVPVEVSGDVYVVASRTRPFPDDPYCAYHGYDASPVRADADDPPTVRLRLEMHLACA